MLVPHLHPHLPRYTGSVSDGSHRSGSLSATDADAPGTAATRSLPAVIPEPVLQPAMDRAQGRRAAPQLQIGVVGPTSSTVASITSGASYPIRSAAAAPAPRPPLHRSGRASRAGPARTQRSARPRSSLVAVDDLIPHDRHVERVVMTAAASTSSTRTVLPQDLRSTTAPETAVEEEGRPASAWCGTWGCPRRTGRSNASASIARRSGSM